MLRAALHVREIAFTLPADHLATTLDQKRGHLASKKQQLLKFRGHFDAAPKS